MNTYRFLAYPRAPLWANPSLQGLDAAVVRRSIAGAIVHRLERDSFGQFILELQVERVDHGDAMNDIASGLESMGWTLSQAIITEWATQAVAGATFGTGAGAATGLSSEDPATFLVLTVLGLAVGAVVGSLFSEVRKQYLVTRRPHYMGGGWDFAELLAQSALTSRLATRT